MSRYVVSLGGNALGNNAEEQKEHHIAFGVRCIVGRMCILQGNTVCICLVEQCQAKYREGTCCFGGQVHLPGKVLESDVITIGIDNAKLVYK